MVKENIDGDYTIIKDIGSGSYGVVKLGLSKLDKNYVAIKYIGKKNVKDLKSDLFRELDILKICRHPHIIRYAECYKDDQYYMIVMEYARHGELFDIIVAKNGLDEQDAISVFCQVLSAVEYCHGNMIAHRDIKLENILVTSLQPMTVKLCDFGFAGRVRASLNNTWCGSASYTAPEIIKHKNYNAMKSDIWSMGVLLYGIITGRSPWPMIGERLDFQAILQVRYIIPLTIPLDAASLIRGMIAKRRERFTLKQIKKHRWICDHTIANHLPKRKPVRKIDLILIDKIVALGFDKMETLHAVSENKNVQETAIYHSLVHLFKSSKRTISEPGLKTTRLSANERTVSEPELIPHKIKTRKKYSPATPRKSRKRKNVREIF